ncbi:MAG: PAS domain-containing sensor histidine kinase, partial [Desulfobulbaceae bacterium]|nr:PAS domain-containing sensor histidine kinase [Desulfobulbaceae bacterium]
MLLDKLHSFNQTSAKAEGLLIRQLHWLLFLRVLILTVFLGISGLLQYQDRDLIIPPLRYLLYFIGGIYCFSIASAFFLQKTKHLKHFAFLQIFIDSLIVSTLIFFTGSSQSIFTLMNFLPIIAGGILLYLPGGFFIAAATTFNFGGILLFEFLGYYAHFFPNFNSPLTSVEILLHHFAIPGVTFFLVGLLTSLLSGRLQQTE